MTHFLALIRKQDFADLFKFGIFHANKDRIVEFTCPLDELRENIDLFDRMLAFVNYFESTFTYVFVHYCKASIHLPYSDIEIEEVQNVFPLDNEAKRELETTFDERMMFQEPLWPDRILSFQKQQTIANCKKGVKNVWRIFELSQDDFLRCENYFSDSCIEEVVNELYEGRRPSGKLSLWVYLLRYERHCMYPNTTLGYYMDAIHVVVNCMQSKELDSYEPTLIYKLLDSLDYNLKSDKIRKEIDNSEKAQGIKAEINKLCPDVDYLNVATSFLKLKRENREGLKYDKNLIEFCKSAWPKDFPLSAYLLGWVLGHDKTYDCLYEKLPLPIFKKKIGQQSYSSEISMNTKEEELGIGKVSLSVVMESPISKKTDNKEISKQGDLFDCAEHISKQTEFVMRKLNKDGSISKKYNPITVKTEHEKDAYLAKGWILMETL